MIEGFDIIVFTYADWLASKSTPQHMARLLAEKNRVLFVDTPHSFLYALKGKDPLGAGAWEGPPLQEMEPQLLVYHPPHRFLPVGRLPHAASSRCLAYNGRLISRQVRRIMEELRFENPLIWSFSPLHGDAIPGLGQRRLLIHDIAEEWVNFLEKDADRRLIEGMDCRLARMADMVFVFSEPMLRRREGLNDRTHVVLPAGDVEFFGRAASPRTIVPEDLASKPRPVIGAICVVDPQRFDSELMCKMAKAHPEWSMVVLGPVRREVDLSCLDGVSNVHMANPPRDELPAYLKGFDVALVPYRLNDATRDIYPMKIQEYLAAGKPVVSPRLPVCQHLEGLVYFADTHTEFIGKVEAALEEDDAELVARRQEVAQQNTWRHRLEERSQYIMKLLEEREQS